MEQIKILLVIFCCIYLTSANDNVIHKLPPGFIIGAATSSYQIEGAINEGGRGVSIWDTFVNKIPSPIVNNDTGAVAADSYHKYKEDIQLLKNAGLNHYRFSISWVRILPRGEINDINHEGVNYYNRLIDELIANNLEPMVTIYHWDLPQPLQDLGGWLNPVIADYFEDYAFTLYNIFGDRVKLWITINEPSIILRGYNSNKVAPGLYINGSGEYLVPHNLLRAHAKAYRLYERHFKKTQKGKVGLVFNTPYFMPLTDSDEDRQATIRAFLFTLGIYAHPIFSKKGGYPPLLKQIIRKNSASENRRRSRLPKFRAKEIQDLRGSSDFFGLNHYYSLLISAKTNLTGNESYFYRDTMYESQPDPSWPSSQESPTFYVVPAGMRGILNYIKDNYGNPPVLITENGYGDDGTLLDLNRIAYFDGYLSNMLKAIYIDNCNVIGYTIWSLIDNFEWPSGYTIKYGIYHVNFERPERVRTPKLSSYYIKQLMRTRRLPNVTNIVDLYNLV